MATMQVRMAKADEQDMDAVGDLLNILGGVMEHGMFRDFSDDDGEEVWFDEDSREHLRGLYDQVKGAMERAPGGLRRVVWGYAVLVDPANGLIDPDDDCLEAHPGIRRVEEDGTKGQEGEGGKVGGLDDLAMRRLRDLCVVLRAVCPGLARQASAADEAEVEEVTIPTTMAFSLLNVLSFVGRLAECHGMMTPGETLVDGGEG
jgi:hypothetical protein